MPRSQRFRLWQRLAFVVMIRVAGAVLLLVFASGAQETVLQRLEREAPIRPPLVTDAVENTLEKRVGAVAGRVQHATSRRDLDAGRAELRRKLTESLGYRRLPWPPDLRATQFGAIPRSGYHIEKLGYQTFRNVLVPAHVYVPDSLAGRAPAVLFLGGHWWNEGKAHPDAQAFAINMARLGFIVMIPDPLGTGERGPSPGDHRLVATLLAGLSQPGIAEYETQCAVEYLLSRKDVDPKRIGLTGVDGGGFNTWITAALDDRIAAAVPVDDTFDFTERVYARRANDWNQAADQCELTPGILRYANIQELIAMAIPTPLMMIADAETRPIREYAQSVYSSFDMAARVAHFESSGVGYDKARRQAAYGFLLRTLMNRGDGLPLEESKTDGLPFDAAELACLPNGQRALAGGAILEAARIQGGSDVKIPMAEIKGEAPPPGFRTWGLNAFPVQRVNVATEEGIKSPLTILNPGGYQGWGSAGTLLAIDDMDKESLASDPIVKEALHRNYLVIEMDPRGFGDLSVAHPGWVFGASLLLGENFSWRQAWDIQMQLKGAPMGRQGGVRAIYARGPNSALASAYAIWLTNSDDLTWAVLMGGVTSVSQLLDPLAELTTYKNFAFGGMRALDIPQMLNETKTKTFFIDPLGSVRKLGRAEETTVEQFLRDVW